MKKLRLHLIVLLSFCLIGGSSSASYSASLSFATASTGGTYFAVGGVMATVLSKNVKDITVSALASGGSVENLNLLNSGEADLALSMGPTADDAWNGKNAFKKPTRGFRCIGAVFPEVLCIIANKDSKATSVAGLAGKRVAIGAPGSGQATTMHLVFSAAGMNVDKDIKKFLDPYSGAAAKMQDGHLDAASIVNYSPSSSIMEISAVMDLNYVSLTEKELSYLKKNAPSYVPYTIPANTYTNKQPVITIASQAGFYCRTDLDEKIVYELTKALYENADQVAAGHAAGADCKLEKALDGITTPFHPGAVRYFKEKGLNIDPSLL